MRWRLFALNMGIVIVVVPLVGFQVGAYWVVYPLLAIVAILAIGAFARVFGWFDRERNRRSRPPV